MNTTKFDYVDSDGIKRRVLLPTNDGMFPDEGIPLSLPVDRLYPHMPLEFRRALVEALWNVGLIEPADFTAGGAAQQIQAALLSVVRLDAMDILALAKEVMKHGK